MPTNSKAKAEARERKARTGESYVRSRRLTAHTPPPDQPKPNLLPQVPTYAGREDLHYVRGYELLTATGYLVGSGTLAERVANVGTYFVVKTRHPKFNLMVAMPEQDRIRLEREFNAWLEDSRGAPDLPISGDNLEKAYTVHELQALAKRMLDICVAVMHYSK